MPDLNDNIQHLKGDVKSIHDRVEHLNTHSKICNELVKESNLREAAELFGHLQQIDIRIHEVQKHISHIKKHIEQDSAFTPGKEILDIDDLKHDATHTNLDLEDIHTNIEHLLTHANMCQDIVAPSAEKELGKIKKHLEEIDERAHELLEHIKEIRGGISLEFSEFVWPIPRGFDEFLRPSRYIVSNAKEIKELALKLVDGAESIETAIVNILCFVRDFIEPKVTKSKMNYQASKTLTSGFGSSVAKSILACSFARAVNIPSKIHFWRMPIKTWEIHFSFIHEKKLTKDFSIACPEFYVEDSWLSNHELLDQKLDVSRFHNRFIELGITKIDLTLDPNQWMYLPTSKLTDEGSYAKPILYLNSPKYSLPPKEIDLRLFGGLIYLGPI